jgi:hypothetical protein
MLVLTLTAPAGAAVVAAPGWAARTLPTPATLQGGVVRAGGALLVGQGPTFTAGAQTIVRLDGGGATTIATGFNSLGGFALDGAGTLWVVDNGGELAGAVSGDTLYAIPDALGRTTPVAAPDAEVVPAGSLPLAADLALAPGAVLVSEAAGPGAGRVVRVAGGSVSPFLSGFAYTAGVLLPGDGTLLVADVDASFVGSVSRFALDGTPLGVLVGGLSGAYGLAADNDGQVLVSGGFTDDFSSSTVLAVAADGSTTERARGFAFSGELFHDLDRDETLVVDFGVTDVVAICRERDGDGVCDADDPCTAGVPLVAGTKLVFGKLAPPAGDETLTFKGELQLPAPITPALDPVGTGARVVVEGAAGTVVDVTIPSGAFSRALGAGWKVNRAGTVWTFRSATGVLGIRRVVLKTAASSPGLVRFVVVGKQGRWAVDGATLPTRATLVLDAPVARGGQCGEGVFVGACAVNARGTTVRCR